MLCSIHADVSARSRVFYWYSRSTLFHERALCYHLEICKRPKGNRSCWESRSCTGDDVCWHILDLVEVVVYGHCQCVETERLWQESVRPGCIPCKRLQRTTSTKPGKLICSIDILCFVRVETNDTAAQYNHTSCARQQASCEMQPVCAE